MVCRGATKSLKNLIIYIKLVTYLNQAQRLRARRRWAWALGSGPRYQILSHIFARCASQKTH